jgi:hypothetical protein
MFLASGSHNRGVQMKKVFRYMLILGITLGFVASHYVSTLDTKRIEQQACCTNHQGEEEPDTVYQPDAT